MRKQRLEPGPRLRLPKEGASITRTWYQKIPPTRNSRGKGQSQFWDMKKLTFLSLIGITSIALTHSAWAAGDEGGAGVVLVADSAGIRVCEGLAGLVKEEPPGVCNTCPLGLGCPALRETASC